MRKFWSKEFTRRCKGCSTLPALFSTVERLLESILMAMFLPEWGMSLHRKPELHLGIAHVLFMDVVGFSKLLITTRARYLSNFIKSSGKPRIEAEATGKLLRL